LSFNVESARYKEIKDDRFYVPPDWTDEMKEAYTAFAQTSFDMYHSLIEAGVQAGISRTRMKESARFARVYGAQISYYVTFNFRSFVDFLELRLDYAAQREIHLLAEAMLELVKQIPDNPFKYSLYAFGYK
jgi:thymidylate synthase ThyX